jgi:hypothetical protein
VGVFPSTAFFIAVAVTLALPVASARAQAPADAPSPKADAVDPAKPGTQAAPASSPSSAEADNTQPPAASATGAEAAKTEAATAATVAAAAAVATKPLTGSLEAGVSQERSQFNQVRIGDSPVILIPGDTVRRNEPFRHFAAALDANLATPVKSLNFIADANYDSHIGFHSSDVDTVYTQGDIGLQYGLGKNIVGVKGNIERWQVGGSDFRRVRGLGIDMVSSLTDQLSSYLLVNLSTYRHPGDQSVVDADYRAVTGNLRWGSKDAWSSAYTLQGTYSRELNKGNDPALDVNAVLIRAAWDSKPVTGWDLGVSTILQGSKFGAVDPLFGVRRNDRYTGLDVNLGHDLGKYLYARLDLGYARYRSNVEGFDNDWGTVGVVVSWKF